MKTTIKVISTWISRESTPACYPKDLSFHVAVGSPSACKKIGWSLTVVVLFCHQQPLNCPTSHLVGWKWYKSTNATCLMVLLSSRYLSAAPVLLLSEFLSVRRSEGKFVSKLVYVWWSDQWWHLNTLRTVGWSLRIWDWDQAFMNMLTNVLLIEIFNFFYFSSQIQQCGEEVFHRETSRLKTSSVKTWVGCTWCTDVEACNVTCYVMSTCALLKGNDGWRFAAALFLFSHAASST